MQNPRGSRPSIAASASLSPQNSVSRTTRWRGRSRGFAFAKLSAEEGLQWIAVASISWDGPAAELAPAVPGRAIARTTASAGRSGAGARIGGRRPPEGSHGRCGERRPLPPAGDPRHCALRRSRRLVLGRLAASSMSRARSLMIGARVRRPAPARNRCPPSPLPRSSARRRAPRGHEPAKTRMGFKEQLDLAATGGINIHITGGLPRQKMLTDEPEDGK